MSAEQRFKEFISGPQLDAFIGKKVDYYRCRWWVMLEKVGSVQGLMFRPSWNWSAVFAGPIWFIYRKMYALTAAVILSFVVAQTLEELMGMAFPVLQCAVLVAMGVLANGLYAWHAAKKMELVIAQDGALTDAGLHRLGGTSLLAAFLLSLALTALVAWGVAEALSKFQTMSVQGMSVPGMPDLLTGQMIK